MNHDLSVKMCMLFSGENPKSFFFWLGEPGLQGPPGQSGERGEPGVDGIPGFVGERGEPGKIMYSSKSER